MSDVRLIDADALMELARNHVNRTVDCNDIARFPTIETVPVVHGRWAMDEDPHDGDCRCTACGVVCCAMRESKHDTYNVLTGGKWWTYYRYCPNCGAKMDGKG